MSQGPRTEPNLTPPGGTYVDALELVNQALAQEQQGDYATACDLYRGALAWLPHNSTLRFNLANALRQSGAPASEEEARTLYLEALEYEPNHWGAWNNLGTLLFESGYVSAARTAFQAAVAALPGHLGARLNLGQACLALDDLEQAQAEFERALRDHPATPAAHQGLAAIAGRRGEEALACYHRDAGYGPQPVNFWAGIGPGPRQSLLILGSASEANTPWRHLIDHTRLDCTSIALEYWNPQHQLPKFERCFNAIGDADRCAATLSLAARLIRDRDCVNHPARIGATGRHELAHTLAGIEGLRLARNYWLDTAALVHAPPPPPWPGPYLVRAAGYHGGQFLELVTNWNDLPTILQRLPGSRWLISEFLDTRTATESYCKYRVMGIAGRLYPLQRACSRHWNVHYFNSDMAEDSAARGQEAEFLNQAPTVLGSAAWHVLEQVQARIGLDYMGMDFALDGAGQVVLFEANATMALQPLTPDQIWDYRRPALNLAIAATKALLAGSDSGGHAPTLFSPLVSGPAPAVL